MGPARATALSRIDPDRAPKTPIDARFDLQAWRRKLTLFALQGFRGRRDAEPASAQPIDRVGIHRVLICRPNHRLGNLLLLTPLLAELQARLPGAQVDLVVGGVRSEALFRAYPNVGNVFCLPRHAFRQPLKLWSVLRAMRRERYDLVIDPDVSSRSSRELTRRCRSTYRIGFSGIKPAKSLSHAMPTPTIPRHMGQLPVLLLRWAMIRPVDGRQQVVPGLDLRLQEHERDWGRRRLAELIGIEPGAALPATVALFTHATGAKRYDNDWWGLLLKSLRAQFPAYAFLEIVPAHGRASLGGRIPTYYSSSPRRLASIIGATRLFLTADCGIMHLACAARGPRVIGLFKSTDPAVYGPYGSDHCAVSTAGKSAAELGACVVHSLP